MPTQKTKPARKGARPQRSKRSSKARKPAAQPKKKMSQKTPALKMVCPSFSATPYFTYPVSFKTSAITMPANYSVIVVLAPFNDQLGAAYFQAVSPPNATTAVSPTIITDPYVTSVLSRVSTTGATNAPSVRWTSFCAELLVSDSLANVNNTIQIVRWDQSGVPLVASGAAPEFFSMYSSVQEHPRLLEQPSAVFTHARCVRTYMQDRSALEFTPVNTGSSAWSSVYGDTGTTTDIGSFPAPWAPLVITMSGTSTISLRLVIKGTMEIQPALNSFLTRLAKPRQACPVGAEEAWFRGQRAIYDEGIRATVGTATQLPGRSSAAFVGL